MYREAPAEAGSSLVGSDGTGFLERPPRLDDRSTSDEINQYLFGSWPAVAPTPPTPTSPEGAPHIASTDPLVRKIFNRVQRKLEVAERAGMARPVFVVTAGQPWGESRDDLINAAIEYRQTGQVPKPLGDTMSYLTSLVSQAAKAGVMVRVQAPKEVREHAGLARLRKRLGDRVEWADSHDLGGVLPDIADDARELRALQKQRENPDGDSLEDIDELIAACNARIDARLAWEDDKITAIVSKEDADPAVSAIMPMMGSYTWEGGRRICLALQTNIKDIDGLHPDRKAAGKRYWDEITAHAMLLTAEFLNGGKLRRGLVTQLGKGALIGQRLAGLAKVKSGRLIDGKDAIQAWAADPGDDPVGVLLLAARGADFVDARKVRQGPPKFDRKGRLIIVDGGVVSVTNPVTGKRETHGNLDLSTLPRDGSVIATNRVGPVTSALAVERIVDAAIEQFNTKQPKEARVVLKGLAAYAGRHRHSPEPAQRYVPNIVYWLRRLKENTGR